MSAQRSRCWELEATKNILVAAETVGGISPDVVREIFFWGCVEDLIS